MEVLGAKSSADVRQYVIIRTTDDYHWCACSFGVG